MTPARIAILISGRGSNMQSIIKACESKAITGVVCCVLSNKAQAKGLDFARSHDIPTKALSHKDYDSREAFDSALVASLQSYKPDIIVLAGFMRILTPIFINAFKNRILNIHPSLLPKYPGLHTHQRAIDAKDQYHGASVHFVTTELDSGPVIIQSKVHIEQQDTEESLTEKVLHGEHFIYPKALDWVNQGLITTDGKQCFYKNSAIIQPANWYNSTLTQPIVAL